jgi:acyl dehydratase
MGTHRRLGDGWYWDDLKVGDTFETVRRTITEADLVAFCNLAWFTEELFTNVHDRDKMAIQGRVVPGALVYSFAEGLIVPSIQHTGLKGPTFVGDTIGVEVEVTEMRATSKPDRGLIRTRNLVRNQHGTVTLEYTPLRMQSRRV